MRIAELEISGGIEFEGTNYRYWDFEVDDIVVKVAEFALQKALLPDYPETKYKNFTAESLDPLAIKITAYWLLTVLLLLWYPKNKSKKKGLIPRMGW
jgi:hypothetical protein